MNNTQSTNNTLTTSYLEAASEIQDLFENLGFTSDQPHDAETIKSLISEIIRKKLQSAEESSNFPYKLSLNE